jgi:hypothetical protein
MSKLCLKEQSFTSAEVTKPYLEIEVIVPETVADQVSNFLIELGSIGVWSRPAGENIAAIGYLSDNSDPDTINGSILQYLDELKMLGFQTGESKYT